MADAVVGLVLENLNSLILREFSLIYGVKDDLSKLSETLSTIRDVLADAERRHITEKPIANWLMKLKHAAYDADDVLAEWLTEADQVSTSGSSFLNSMNLLFRHKMAKKIKKMLRTFEELGKQKLHFMLTFGPFPEMHSQFDENRETISNISEHVYGRDEDKKRITHMLLNNEGGRKNVTVFPIVGMGGLGKTTLAQSAYNDERVEKFFEPRIWVCVSDLFDVKRVLKGIIEAFDKKSCDLKILEPIQSKVKEIIKDKKYLLVLDDVWNEEQDKWNQLIGLLKCGAQGSSIILTTRSQKVASITSVVQPYNLGGLSDNDCWLLIKNYAFGDGNEEEHHPNLVPIGKAIAERCKGLPLVAKTLGGLLGLKTEEDHWNHVKDNEIWNSKEGKENSILHFALKLSYDHLPSCLKQCFAFCSIYPKGHRMERERLISLWIANGYIQSQESKELEEIGNDTFDELLQRSFFQDADKDDYGNIGTCKMHDLMHDLAVSVALDECLAVEVGVSIKDVPKTIRHLSVIPDSSQSSTLDNPLLTPHSSLRTLLFFGSIDFDSYKFSSTLRVLDLSYMEITKVPPSIFHLKLLRCLDLSVNDISLLPKSICKLRNLQMLDLNCNRNLRTLPSSIVKVETLRYLNLSFTSIASLPESFNGLKSLRCLNVSQTLITSLPESIFMLTNLRSLDLENLEIKLPPAIRKLVNLRHLNLRDCSFLESIPETVCDLTNLQSLLLRGATYYNSTEIPIGIGKLTNLRTLGGVPFILENSDSGGLGINELQRLNQLRGKLKIRGLQNVRNAEEARTANLGSKQYLTKLELSWSYSSDEDSGDDGSDDGGSDEDASYSDDEDGDDDRDDYGYGDDGGNDGGSDDDNASYSNEDGEDDDSDGNDDNGGSLQVKKHKNNNESQEVLEGLLFHPHPPPNLQSLKICAYCAEELPQELQKLTSLTSFTIEDCENIKRLPVIGVKDNSNYNSSLLDLKIGGCWGLTSVSEGLRYLTSLQQLEISYCPKLLTQEEDEGKDGFQYLIFLEKLVLKYLPQLTALPKGIQSLPMLKTLEISEWENLTSVSQGLWHLTSLQQLEISDCPKLLELGTEEEEGKDVFQYLVSLEKLVLEGLPQFRALPQGIQRLPKLKTLEISEWENLTSVSQGLRYLTSLQQLKISDCPKLMELVTQKEEEDGFQHLISLEMLVLKRLPQFRALSEGIQCLPMLKTLEISEWENLTSVSEGLRYLTSLQQLEVSDCPKLQLVTKEEEEDGFQYLISLEKLVLKHLPQFTALPEGLQRLPMLKTLEISGWKNLSSVSEGLRYLTLLQQLEIGDCPKLLELVTDKEGKDVFQYQISIEKLVLEDLPQFRALPTGIQHLSMLTALIILRCENLRVLPEWLKCLTTLQTLHIYLPHPDLAARCEKGKGKDWHKISHIPDFLIY